MPPHPDLLGWIQAQGYDSVTLVNLQRLEAWKQFQGIDQPEPITAPMIGTRPAIVLLVDFSDMTRNAVSTPASYSSMLFSVGTYAAPGSLRDYYREVSYSLFDITPSAVDTAWRRAPNVHTYYANHDGITGTSDDYGLGPWPYNAQSLVVDAVTLAHSAGVNFSTYAVNGQVDGLFVIHAGPGAETNPGHRDWIWSHRWALNANAMTVDGVTVNDYSMEPEYTWTAGDSTVGVFCHEYGHILGLPDLYDTSYVSNGLGVWSLMAAGGWNGPGSNGSSPAHLDAWCKIQLGWIDPTIPVAAVVAPTIQDVETTALAYKLWTTGVMGNEYFLLENRQLLDFDGALPGGGLLLYHVDDAVPDQTSVSHPKIMLQQADGLWDLQVKANQGDAGDPYPGTSNNRAANAHTLPNTNSYAPAPTSVRMREISGSGLSMTADLAVVPTWSFTPGLYDPVSSKFYLRNANSAGAADLTFRYGAAQPGWVPVAGDWDRNATSTVGLYQASEGKFYLKNTNVAGEADLVVRYGPVSSTWRPLVGDWDGDGYVTIGLYNPSTGTFYLRNSNTAGAADLTFRFGPTASTWTPIVGDWNADGKDTIGLYDPVAGKFYLRNSNSGGAADVTFRFGPAQSSWLPIAGDWDADAVDTIGLYNPTTGTYFLRNTNAAGAADVTFRYGPAPNSWLPVVGDWDGI